MPLQCNKIVEVEIECNKIVENSDFMPLQVQISKKYRVRPPYKGMEPQKYRFYASIEGFEVRTPEKFYVVLLFVPRYSLWTPLLKHHSRWGNA